MAGFLFFICFLFFSGVSGMFLSRQHLIILLLSLEVSLFSVTVAFVFFSVLYDDLLGQLYALLLLSFAAGETALGLALVVVYYRLRGGIALDLLELLKA